ncbi:DNA mismatch repair endonuclease MutL [Anaerobacillus sp. MEB173]|uniref:DNA mismatch repair endonuclease MutL n=1 Tax=Anaerobacillus sp. MEB173 TaxID=3383345 RepID=UPI003F8E6664
MGKINKLNEHLSNKIAAGEVVERPASIVKELVENAIDANSTRIEVDVEEGGLSKIRVLDNGDGIEKDDCEVAFFRHATSKIKTDRDLFRVLSLGFRGEALPSIASVSFLEMKTSTGNGPGTHLILEGGKIIENKSASSRKGTEIIVTNLFYNTPARLKYLKTVHTELGNISDIMNRLALAHPTISFKLNHNGKPLLNTNGSGEQLHVIAQIYGHSVAKKMLPLSLESIDFKVTGYVAKPEITRASRQYISTFINGRYIKNYPLSKAIQQGYHTLLPIGRYPLVVINIKLDPLLIDVNVHPSKLEVRLSKEQDLNQLVEDGIKAVFKRIQLIPEVQKKTIEKPKNEQLSLTITHQQEVKQVPYDSERVIEFHEEYEEQNSSGFNEGYSPAEVTVENKNQVEGKKEPLKTEVNIAVSDYEELDEEESIDLILDQGIDRIPVLYPIGQMHGTYILAQNDNGLYIIDQHAAQERIKYEYYREKVGQVNPQLQELLLPLTFEFTLAEKSYIEEHLKALEQVGIFLEEFGPQTFLVRSHPTWFPKGQEEETIKEMIDQVVASKKVDIKKLREDAAILMSCKASIKANRHLRHDEMFALLETLRTCSDPFTCPHGRPILLHFTTYEMEKMFKRVM